MLNIILCGSDPTQLESLKSAAKSAGIEVCAAILPDDAKSLTAYIRQHRVDAVFADTDKGCELIGIINAAHTYSPLIRVVVLSGKDRPEDVKRAIRAGAYDYFVKPCGEEVLAEALRAVSEGLNGEETRETRPKGTVDRLIANELSLNQVFNTPGIVKILMVHSDSRTVLHSFVDSFAAVLRELAVFELCYRDGCYVFLINDTEKTNITGVLHDIYDKFPGAEALRIAIGNTRNSSFNFLNHYTSCLYMFSFQIFNGMSGFFDLEQYNALIDSGGDFVLTTHFSHKELYGFLMKKDNHAAKKYIREAFGSVARLDAPFDDLRVKAQLYDEVQLFENGISAFRGKSAQGSMYEESVLEQYDTIRRLQTKDALCEWAVSYFSRRVDSIYMDLKPVYILEAIKYINENYMNVITLNDVAEHVYLNMWYFSTQFKKYTGLSIKEYINKVRIDKAKELLSRQNLKIYQISEMVGFQDCAYFITVFKNLEKMTPNQYKRVYCSK